MRRPNKTFLISLAAAASLVIFAARGQQPPAQAKPPAQTKANPDENTGTIFRSDIRLVVLNTTVSDKNGHLITDLPQTAFTVYENGATQPIKSFKREDVPVSMGLIID